MVVGAGQVHARTTQTHSDHEGSEVVRNSELLQMVGRLLLSASDTINHFRV